MISSDIEREAYQLGYNGKMYDNPYTIGTHEYRLWAMAYAQGVRQYHEDYHASLVEDMQERIHGKKTEAS